MIRIIGLKMIRVIEVLISKTENNPSHVLTRQYVSKVRDLLANMLKVGPSFSVAWVIPSIIYLVIGYFPVFNLAVSLTYVNGPFFQFAVAFYAKRQRLIQQQKDEASNLVSLDSKIQNELFSTFKSSEDDTDSSGPQAESEGSFLSLPSKNEIKNHKPKKNPSQYSYTISHVNGTELTTVHSVTEIVSSSDPAILSSNQKWRLRSNWVESVGPDGLIIYFNKVTNEFSFDPPPENE